MTTTARIERWISFSLPRSSLSGFAAAIPANFIIALATMTGWLLSSSKPVLRNDRMLMLLLAGLIALSTLFSLSHAASIPKFKEYMINVTFMVMLLVCLNNKIRIDAFVWLMVLCIGYYSLEGGIFFLLGGGAYRFEGPPGTSISDNDHLAVAFLLTIPLINHLRLHASMSMVRHGLTGLLLLTILAVLSTQSRGGFIGLLALGGAFWWMSERRLSHIVAMTAIVTLAAALASDNLVSRLQTIESAHHQDTSFLSRVVSWQMRLAAAVDRPILGTGPRAIQTWPVFDTHRPTSPIADLQLRRPVAAHSAYFQVLGEHVFVTFGLYITLIWTAWRNTSWVMRHVPDRPDDRWMVNLARMTRVSLLTFAVAGTAVSMAFYDLFLAVLALTACVRRKLEEQLEPEHQDNGGVRRRLGQVRNRPALAVNRLA